MIIIENPRPLSRQIAIDLPETCDTCPPGEYIFSGKFATINGKKIRIFQKTNQEHPHAYLTEPGAMEILHQVVLKTLPSGPLDRLNNGTRLTGNQTKGMTPSRRKFKRTHQLHLLRTNEGWHYLRAVFAEVRSAIKAVA